MLESRIRTAGPLEFARVGTPQCTGRRNGWLAGLCAVALVVAGDARPTGWPSNGRSRTHPSVQFLSAVFQRRICPRTPGDSAGGFEPEPVGAAGRSSQPFVADLALPAIKRGATPGLTSSPKNRSRFGPTEKFPPAGRPRVITTIATQVGPEGTFLYCEKMSEARFSPRQRRLGTGPLLLPDRPDRRISAVLHRSRLQLEADRNRDACI